MQEKESQMALWCELKIPSFGIAVRYHTASLVMPNNYPRDGNPHFTTIKDSYNLSGLQLQSNPIWFLIGALIFFYLNQNFHIVNN